MRIYTIFLSYFFFFPFLSFYCFMCIGRAMIIREKAEGNENKNNLRLIMKNMEKASDGEFN